MAIGGNESLRKFTGLLCLFASLFMIPLKILKANQLEIPILSFDIMFDLIWFGILSILFSISLFTYFGKYIHFWAIYISGLIIIFYNFKDITAFFFLSYAYCLGKAYGLLNRNLILKTILFSLLTFATAFTGVLLLEDTIYDLFYLIGFSYLSLTFVIGIISIYESSEKEKKRILEFQEIQQDLIKDLSEKAKNQDTNSGLTKKVFKVLEKDSNLVKSAIKLIKGI